MTITAFAIASGQNTGGKNDATGAFLPGAQKFGKAYNCVWRSFDPLGESKKVRKRFLDTIQTYCPGGCNYFAYFGHGYTNGLGSADLSSAHLDSLMEVLRPKMAKPFFVALYACSCGVANGFASKLREKIGADAWVYAHTTVGHSYVNSDVSEEASAYSPTWRLLHPHGSPLRDPWKEALKYTDLWHRFPLISDWSIEGECNARRLLGIWELNWDGEPWLYEFDTTFVKWSIESGRALDEYPAGTVKAFSPKKPSELLDTGTWHIEGDVYVKWYSGYNETWFTPLNALGQTIDCDGTALTAKRKTHTYGKNAKLQY